MNSDLKAIAILAYQSLIAEVQLAPKPGLVDPESNGAHDDMDYPLF
ncbi:triphosphoribosyl-dephospho-CoA synthase [Latilactobacillus sakei]